MKIAFIASRNYPGRESWGRQFIKSLDIVDIILLPGLTSYETALKEAAVGYGIKVETLEVDPDLYKEKPTLLPLIRAKLLVARSDKVVCFWDGSSKEIQMVIKVAQVENSSIIVFGPDGSPINVKGGIL